MSVMSLAFPLAYPAHAGRLRAEAPCMASRSFVLPTNVDPRGVEVELEDGVLDITLPKRTDTSGNKVVLELQPLALHMDSAGAYPALS
jgi:hypothetical protein